MLENTPYILSSDNTYLVNKNTGRRLNQFLDKDGYIRYSIYKNSKKVKVSLHKIIAHKYLGECPKGLVVNHIDGNKLNNKPNNLEYVTPTRNTEHAKELGLIPNGLNHNQSKLDVIKLLTIYTVYLSGKSHRESLSKTYKISKQGISRICRGENYPEQYRLIVDYSYSLDDKRSLFKDKIRHDAILEVLRLKYVEGKTVNFITIETKLSQKMVKKILNRFTQQAIDRLYIP